MQSLRVICFLLLAITVAGCVASSDGSGPSDPTASPRGSSIQLSDADANAIGRKIWQNECAGTVEGLTTWNTGEDFPSLGIGHFIWYVKGRRGPFEESFPSLLAYMDRRGVTMPQWLRQADGSPWQSRAEFISQQNSPKMKELRQFLANTVAVQTGFIVLRLENALPKMSDATSQTGDRQRLYDNFYKVASTRTGIYALIDYVNFKGEGIKDGEKYNNQGWGLRDVLLDMGDTSGGQASANEFSEAAKRMLQRRVRNAPAARGEGRWLQGWMNRCETYKRGI